MMCLFLLLESVDVDRQDDVTFCGICALLCMEEIAVILCSTECLKREPSNFQLAQLFDPAIKPASHVFFFGSRASSPNDGGCHTHRHSHESVRRCLTLGDYIFCVTQPLFSFVV